MVVVLLERTFLASLHATTIGALTSEWMRLQAERERHSYQETCSYRGGLRLGQHDVIASAFFRQIKGRIRSGKCVPDLQHAP